MNKNFRQAKLSHHNSVFPNRSHPQMFRHSKAFHLLESGVNLIYIRDLLGYVSVTTTEVYLKFDTELKRKSLEAAYLEIDKQNAPDWQQNNDILQWLKYMCD